MARISALNLYPLKGGTGTAVREAALTPAGLAHDRTFLVVDPDGVFRSQRSDPRLALVRTDVGPGGEHVTLRAPGADALHLDVDLTTPRTDVEMFEKPYRGIDQGDAVAAWLTGVLGAPSRLVRVPPEHDRVTGGATPGTAAYADSSAVHLISTSSLDLLNDRLAERGDEPLPMNRFRPNIVVDGWDEPHTEDRLRSVRVGDAALAYAKLAIRCVVTTVDQELGATAGPEPLRTLAGYRRAGSAGVAFGVLLAVAHTGTLRVGDEVVVDAWDPGNP